MLSKKLGALVVTTIISLFALPAMAADGTIQAAALTLFILSALSIIGIFIWVARTTMAPCDPDINAAYRLRRVLFIGATALVLIALVFTLPRSPYALNGTQPDRLVYVTAMQYAFIFSIEPVSSMEDLATVNTISTLELPIGAMVEFRVTSLDVNHNFAVYNEAGVLVGQTQAMPGYVNRLQLRFDGPGSYQVLCLEYCGIAHHVMTTTFNVVTQVKPLGG